ncbi:hypothetical protein SO694_00081049 [Aureococcus anophagefferens]|uniref:Uncharacterized protein n=1 Tax=Aureococcus anophagefferens TaxID=44056 RepID=A0ABR1G4Q8_AURAN
MSEGDGPSRGVKRSIADVGATKQEAPPAGALGAGGGRQQESIYNSLLLLLLRESGAAVELHRLVTAGPAGRVGAAPAERAYERAIEAQRTWVCALAPWAERSAAFDGATCDRLVDFTKRLVAVSEALDRVADGDACPHHSKPSGDAAARLWSDHADADAKHSARLGAPFPRNGFRGIFSADRRRARARRDAAGAPPARATPGPPRAANPTRRPPAGGARASAPPDATALDAAGARLGGVAAELEREGRRRGAAAPFHDETGILPLCAAVRDARVRAALRHGPLPAPEAPEPAARRP